MNEISFFIEGMVVCEIEYLLKVQENPSIDIIFCVMCEYWIYVLISVNTKAVLSPFY
jgi:hypothetical protein